MIQIEKNPFYIAKCYVGVWQDRETTKSYIFTLTTSENEYGIFSHDIAWEKEVPDNEEDIKERIINTLKLKL